MGCHYSISRRVRHRGGGIDIGVIGGSLGGSCGVYWGSTRVIQGHLAAFPGGTRDR